MSSPDSARASSSTVGRLSSRTWRIRHSAWMLAPILSIGLFSWVGFVYIGIRARRAAWWGAGAVYFSFFIVFLLLPTGAAQAEATGQEEANWQGGVLVAIWAASILHAFLINRSWLRWRAAYRATPWYADPPPGAPLAAPPGGSGSAVIDNLTGDRSAFFAPAPITSPIQAKSADGDLERPLRDSPVQHARGPVSLPTSTTPQVPLDVNTADETQLRGLPGMTSDRVRHALSERAARRGFTSTQEFADAIGLQAHEYARLRQALACSPRAAGSPPQSRQSGRVVDF